MDVKLAQSRAAIEACQPVLQQLRPQLTSATFYPQILQQQKKGYQLAYIEQEGQVVAVAGFRKHCNLAWGEHIYIDDLVSCPHQRSQGLGKALLDFIKAYAAQQGCQQLHLDSGAARQDAHRFYQREGLQPRSLHFSYFFSTQS
jgi:GNAT superfamily N-acetyltransferase